MIGIVLREARRPGEIAERMLSDLPDRPAIWGQRVGLSSCLRRITVRCFRRCGSIQDLSEMAAGIGPCRHFIWTEAKARDRAVS